MARLPLGPQGLERHQVLRVENMAEGETVSYLTAANIGVSRSQRQALPDELEQYVAALDHRVGGLLTSGYEYPGRYSRWDLGYLDPCLELSSQGRSLTATALTARGLILLPAIRGCLAEVGELTQDQGQQLEVEVPENRGFFTEEDRSRQPSVFSVLRRLLAAFAHPEEPHLGLYGAFGYDLAFQFEPITLKHPRHGSQRQLVLHLPDQILVIDRMRELARVYSYEFEVSGKSTLGIPREPVSAPARPSAGVPDQPEPGGFAAVVREAKKAFISGDLFEVVPSQTFYRACPSPSAFFRRLTRANPAPYGFFFNLGQGEYLVGASPEMFVRVEGDRVETCPIAGTVARGADAIEDASNIRMLLQSAKEEAELTMCTDVDRNDKARVCVPGSVRVIGRRQIELYSRLIHTVDHVEGQLSPDRDALDALLTHMWAVTVTGAPKRWAMQFIENTESAPRDWYGGAVGTLRFNGSMNTGLTLRTAHIRDGVAAVRAGATLLYDSDPESEEAETHLKASALLAAVAEPVPPLAPGEPGASWAEALAPGPRVLLVDHEDSFVHTLADYMRQAGAQVQTVRWGVGRALLEEYSPNLVVLSPGPGRPEDFGCAELLELLTERGTPVFGVCLGLQALVEFHGGRLAQLDQPMHGKSSLVQVAPGPLREAVGAEVTVGRYHSLYAERESLPPRLEVLASSEDGVIMALRHRDLPHWGVQFHPESIMSLGHRTGHRMIRYALEHADSSAPAEKARAEGGR